jgi:hypothetical protein
MSERGRKRTYTSQFRLTCLTKLSEQLAHSRSREEAIGVTATSMGVPITTLRRWAHEELGPARAESADEPLRVRELTRENEVLRAAVAELTRLANGEGAVTHSVSYVDGRDLPAGR